MNFIDKNKCSGCTACMNICPKNCIKMQPDKEGFLYPEADAKLCVECGMCQKVCPIDKTLRHEPNSVYAAKNKDNDARLNSTSGAIFTAISKYVFSKNGIVVGCKFNEKFEAVHDFATNLKEMESFRGAKYVQSILDDTFKKVKTYLKNEKIVLFTGTPCQVAGLTSYLGCQYENLITCDLVCHSVPSSIALKAYINELESDNSSKIKSFLLREKSLKGWQTSNLKVEFENGEVYKELLKNTTFMKGFNKGLFNRPSCANCSYKDFRGTSDITIGDYWGIELKDRNFMDNLGVSLVLVNSEKGKEIFNQIEGELEYINTEIKDAVLKNPYVVTSSPAHKNRGVFFEEVGQQKFSALVEKLLN